MLPPVENILSDLIKLNSENPPGHEIEVARYLKGLFERFRVPGEIIESKPGRASFIASTGSGERCLLFLSHADVVPAGGGWDFAPFSGEIVDGVVRGRGARDCKGLVAAEAYAALYLAQNVRLGGRLIFAATADEESGAVFGVRHILEHYPEKLRADFAVNEGGEEPILVGGKRVHFVQAGEKGTAWSRIRTRGVSAHGSTPTLGDNAVTRMAEAIVRLGRYSPEVKFIPEVKTLLQGLSDLKGLGLPVNKRHVDTIIDSFEDRAFAAYLRALVRMTVSPNAINGGTKTNIVPDSCEADIDIRILPGQDREYVLAELGRVVGEGPEIQIMNYSPPTFSPTNGEPFRLICETMQEVAGEDVLCLPCLSAGATDSRFLRPAGIPSYGIAMAASGADPEQKKTVHGRNERVDIETLKLKTEFLIRLAQKYLAAGDIANI